MARLNRCTHGSFEKISSHCSVCHWIPISKSLAPTYCIDIFLRPNPPVVDHFCLECPVHITDQRTHSVSSARTMQCVLQKHWITRDVAKRLQNDLGSLRADAGRRRITAETVGQRKELAKLAVILRTSGRNESWPHRERAKETPIDSPADKRGRM